MAHDPRYHEFLARLRRNNISAKVPQNSLPFPIVSELYTDRTKQESSVSHYQNLPLELRQRVLYYALDLIYQFKNPYWNWLTSRISNQDYADCLSTIHPTFASDVKYPTLLRNKELAGIWEEQVKAVGVLGQRVFTQMNALKALEANWTDEDAKALHEMETKLLCDFHDAIGYMETFTVDVTNMKCKGFVAWMEWMVGSNPKNDTEDMPRIRSAAEKLDTKIMEEIDEGMDMVGAQLSIWAEVFVRFMTSVKQRFPESLPSDWSLRYQFVRSFVSKN